MCVAPFALFAALWIILQSIVFGSSLKVVLALLLSVFPRANLQSLCLFPSLSGGTDDTLLVHIRPAASHSFASIFCQQQQQPRVCSPLVSRDKIANPRSRSPSSFLLWRAKELLNALSPCRQSPNPRGASTTYRFLCLRAHQIITISHRAHIHPIAGCRHRKISCSSKSFRDAHFSRSLATLFFPVLLYLYPLWSSILLA